MEGKKSFILYSDILPMLNKLPDDKAGQLFKIILRYVNDENPVIDDLLLQVAFEPIKVSLKRDLEKWSAYIEKQRLNGQRGGRPSEAKETQKTQAFPSQPKKADSVSVNDNVSVSESTVRHPLDDFTDTLKNVRKLKVQPTYELWESLIKDFGADRVKDTLQKMDNYKPLTTKCLNVNLTCRNWLNRDNGYKSNNNGGAEHLKQDKGAGAF